MSKSCLGSKKRYCRIFGAFFFSSFGWESVLVFTTLPTKYMGADVEQTKRQMGKPDKLKNAQVLFTCTQRGKQAGYQKEGVDR